MVGKPASRVLEDLLPTLEAGPDAAYARQLLVDELENAVDELPEEQRQVFVAVALNEVPIDVLAERLNTTRGALYKTLHDTRRKLRAALAARGLGIERGWR